MYNLALRMVVDFVGGQVLSNAIHAGGLLCTAIASADPAKAAKQLIPLCIGNIMSELEHGAASTIVNSATSTPIQSDSTLHWYQGILFSTVAAMGSELLNYKTEIINVLKEMTEKCKSRTGFTWSGKLLRASLKTLLAIYPREFRSLTPKEWNSKGKLLIVHTQDCSLDSLVVLLKNAWQSRTCYGESLVIQRTCKLIGMCRQRKRLILAWSFWRLLLYHQ